MAPEATGEGKVPTPEDLHRQRLDAYIDDIGMTDTYQSVNPHARENLDAMLSAAMEQSEADRAEYQEMREKLAREAGVQEGYAKAQKEQAEAAEKKASRLRKVIGGVAVVAAGLAASTAVFASLYFTKDSDSSKVEPPQPKTSPAKAGAAAGSSANASKLSPAQQNMTPAERRLLGVSNYTAIDTAEEAAEAYEGKNYDQAVSDILGNPEAFDNVTISHKFNRYINAPNMGENIPGQEAVEMKLIGIVRDEGNARSALNSLDGKDLKAERSETHAEMIEQLKALLLKPGVKINTNYRINGTWGNGLIDAKTGEIRVKPYTYNNKRAVQILIPGKEAWVYTIDSALESIAGDCFNDQEMINFVQNRTNETHPGTTVTMRTPTKPEKPERPTDCVPLPGQVVYEGRCVHAPRSGPEGTGASQPPHTDTAPATPGYEPGRAEDVDETQQGDPTNLDPTDNGTEAINPPGGGDAGVVSTPPTTAPDNPQSTGDASSGTSVDANPDRHTGTEGDTEVTNEDATNEAGNLPG